ncbi:DUF6691 family protein [Aphanothece microscopica]|uniref:DUF6691 family protein n=1 Tax=Aphanothece microscopica TaxID=1049561 RepID=UPI003984AC34
MMPAILLSLFTGVVFGAGLAISDMVNPARVLNFFDVTGTWDPTLLFVMSGALAVTAIGYRLTFARGKTLTGGNFNLPDLKQIDLPLLGGAAVFGIGWGIAGFCPGPAIAALVSLQPKVWLFVVAMAAGMAGTKYWRSRTASVKATPTS